MGTLTGKGVEQGDAMADMAVSGGFSGAAEVVEPAADLRRAMRAECDAMIRYILGNGLKVPTEVAAALPLLESGSGAGLADLATLHGRLTDLVAPAKPRTILLLQRDKENNPLLNMLGPLPNLRFLMAAAFAFMLVFIVIALRPEINAANMAAGFYGLSGMPLLLVMLLLISAAGLGAGFNALFKAYSYIGDNTYDTRFDSSYWIRIGLGIIAGLLLAHLIQVDDITGSGTADGEAGAHVITMGKPTLALLGGFSATLVFTVLSRLVDTVQSLFKPSATPSAADQDVEVRRKVEQQTGQNRLAVAAGLVSIQDAVAKGATPAEIQAMVSKTLEGLVPGIRSAPTADPATPSAS